MPRGAFMARSFARNRASGCRTLTRNFSLDHDGVGRPPKKSTNENNDNIINKPKFARVQAVEGEARAARPIESATILMRTAQRVWMLVIPFSSFRRGHERQDRDAIINSDSIGEYAGR